jgi:hypothetical protein
MARAYRSPLYRSVPVRLVEILVVGAMTTRYRRVTTLARR